MNRRAGSAFSPGRFTTPAFQTRELSLNLRPRCLSLFKTRRASRATVSTHRSFVPSFESRARFESEHFHTLDRFHEVSFVSSFFPSFSRRLPTKIPAPLASLPFQATPLPFVQERKKNHLSFHHRMNIKTVFYTSRHTHNVHFTKQPC